MVKTPLAPGLVCSLLLGAPAVAATTAEAQALFAALELGGVIAVMHEEGQNHGAAIKADMFPDRIGGAWNDAVRAIYDPDGMRASVERRFAAELADAEVGPLLEFFRSPRGRRIVGLEVDAREALLQPDIEAVAEQTWTDMVVTGDPRTTLLEAYVEANDLVEMNVSGSMNASYAFFQGLADGGAFDGMGEREMLAEVWAQEESIRSDTEAWVYAYLALAYRPLEDADIEAYTALSRTPAGQDLNRALFAAFDAMYFDISRALGRAAAGELLGQDI